MMGLKLTRHERYAGLLVSISFLIFVAWWAIVAMNQGWFEAKSIFYTSMNSADGIYPGLDVLVSGMKVGQVTDVSFNENNQIRVTLEITEKFVDKIRQDSVIRAIRPLVIGEKALEISLGSGEHPVLPPGSVIPFFAQFDFMNFLSGRGSGENFYKLGEAVGNLTSVLNEVLKKERLDRLVHVIDRIDPLLKNLDQMSQEMARLGREINRTQKISPLLTELHGVTFELNKIIPYLAEQAPDLAKHLAILIANLSTLSEQLKVIGPAIKEVGPELPQATRKALEALNESVILLKAVQRSFFLRGHSDDIRREEEQRSPTQERSKLNQK